MSLQDATNVMTGFGTVGLALVTVVTLIYTVVTTTKDRRRVQAKHQEAEAWLVQVGITTETKDPGETRGGPDVLKFIRAIVTNNSPHAIYNLDLRFDLSAPGLSEPASRRHMPRTDRPGAKDVNSLFILTPGTSMEFISRTITAKDLTGGYVMVQWLDYQDQWWQYWQGFVRRLSAHERSLWRSGPPFWVKPSRRVKVAKILKR
jgi:hypothetical protein